MNDVFSKFGFNLNDEQLAKLDYYYRFLVETNQKFNLTAITEKDDVFVKHFLDSLLGEFAFEQNATVCDVGCGAGFPSVPLKILRNDLQICGIDSVNKKVAFLDELCTNMGVRAEFHHIRAEDFAKTHREFFDCVTARAVAPLNVLLEYAVPLLKVGGKVVAYKTDIAELDLCKNAMELLGVKVETTKTFDLFGAQRCIFVLKKYKKTPPKYPRGGNKPRLDPL